MRKESFLWVLLNVNIFCVYLQENSTGEDTKTWWCNRVMFHLEVLGLFSWSILVSILALWNFETFCICLPSFGFGVGGVRCYKKSSIFGSPPPLRLSCIPCCLVSTPLFFTLKCLPPPLYELPYWFSSKGFHWSAVDFPELVDSNRPHSFRGCWVCSGGVAMLRGSRELYIIAPLSN